MRTFVATKRSALSAPRLAVSGFDRSPCSHRAEIRQILHGPRLQAKACPGCAPQVTGDVAAGIRSLNGGGQALPESVRSYFEPRFGVDFSGVRVHTDTGAGELARRLEARAFTVGRDIVFGQGQYAPNSADGKRLLAHELTHAVQQGPSSSGPSEPASDILRKPEPSKPTAGEKSEQAFIAALKLNPPDLVTAYRSFFGLWMRHMLRLLDQLDLQLLEKWKKYTPVYPGDDRTSQARVKVATEVVSRKGTIHWSAIESGLRDELGILPAQQIREVRVFLVKRPASEIYTFSPAGMKFLTKPGNEGFCPRPFDDGTVNCGRGRGHCTIGFGQLLHRGLCNEEDDERFKAGVTRSGARQWVWGRVRGLIAPDVNKKVKVKLNQCQFDALVSMVYNTGTEGMLDPRRTSLLAVLNDGEYELMPGLIASTFSRGVEARRKREAALFGKCQY